MEKSKKLTLADFLSEVPDEYKDFVAKMSGNLIKSGYKQKIERMASGLAATYNTPECKRVHIQFYLNKNVLGMNLHPIFFTRQNGFLDGLPNCVTSQIDMFKDCRHVADPNSCNAKCFECKFTINGTQYHKCNYNRISVEVNEECGKLLSVFQ